MANGNAAPDEPLAGRSAEFNDSATKVRTPNFRTLQNTVGGGARTYQRTSILDNLLPSRVGLGTNDFERAKLGVPRSPMGQSESTFDKGLWLRAARPPDLTTTLG
jgi:hypothetical protein